jgi:hypothetical protein
MNDTRNNSIFFCENDPGLNYDPEGRTTGWYYLNRQQYPIGPFSSSPQATYASAHNEPAPSVCGPIVRNMTY